MSPVPTPAPFPSPSPGTREELGGILERAFQAEAHDPPTTEEARRSVRLAEEAEARAQALQSLQEEAQRAADAAAERYGRSGHPDDLDQCRRWEAEAASYRREADLLKIESERLRESAP